MGYRRILAAKFLVLPIAAVYFLSWSAFLPKKSSAFPASFGNGNPSLRDGEKAIEPLAHRQITAPDAERSQQRMAELAALFASSPSSTKYLTFTRRSLPEPEPDASNNTETGQEGQREGDKAGELDYPDVGAYSPGLAADVDEGFEEGIAQEEENLAKPPVRLPRIQTVANFLLSFLFGSGEFGLGKLKKDILFLRQAARALGIRVDFLDKNGTIIDGDNVYSFAFAG